jgi:hypothetical protein
MNLYSTGKPGLSDLLTLQVISGVCSPGKQCCASRRFRAGSGYDQKPDLDPTPKKMRIRILHYVKFCANFCNKKFLL